MSENKYQPPVNMPENIPVQAEPPVTILVQFLSTDGHWMGFDSKDIALSQKDDSTVSVCVRAGDKTIHLLTYRGVKLVPILEEKTVVVP